ncbi:MAG TPA: hypothetical protein VFC79_02585 [Tissierellaceae bacterium]|nr:hypothetical protein [Tissierellaceae bacterium]
MLKIEGRHWVFIIGFISSLIASKWSSEVAKYMIDLLFFMGLGLWVLRCFS